MNTLIKSIILCISCFCFTTLYAQEVVSTQGDTYSNNQATISYTLGEVVINTTSNNSATLTQGFNQTNWNFLELEDLDTYDRVSIYPNPTTDVVFLSLSNTANTTYTIYDSFGKLILKGHLSLTKTPISLKHLATGVYSIVINQNNRIIKTFHLLKSK